MCRYTVCVCVCVCVLYMHRHDSPVSYCFLLQMFEYPPPQKKSSLTNTTACVFLLYRLLIIIFLPLTFLWPLPLLLVVRFSPSRSCPGGRSSFWLGGLGGCDPQLVKDGWRSPKSHWLPELGLPCRPQGQECQVYQRLGNVGGCTHYQGKRERERERERDCTLKTCPWKSIVGWWHLVYLHPHINSI